MTEPYFYDFIRHWPLSDEFYNEIKRMTPIDKEFEDPSGVGYRIWSGKENVKTAPLLVDDIHSIFFCCDSQIPRSKAVFNNQALLQKELKNVGQFQRNILQIFDLPQKNKPFNFKVPANEEIIKQIKLRDRIGMQTSSSKKFSNLAESDGSGIGALEDFENNITESALFLPKNILKIQSTNFDGAGVKLAVIDYSVNAECCKIHLAEVFDFSSGVENVKKHGNKTLSIIAGSDFSVAPAAEVMIAKISPSLDPAPVVIALVWAAKNGAHLINASVKIMNGKCPIPETLVRAIQFCNQKNCLIVAATANKTDENNSGIANSKLVCSVGGTVGSESVLVKPTINPKIGEKVDCVSYGFNVSALVDFCSQNTEAHNGASAAAPIVCGALALVSQKTGLRGQQLKKMFLDNFCFNPDPGNLAWGRGNVDLSCLTNN